MPRYEGRNHFIVKHDLASFQALPGVIWISDAPPPPSSPPIGFPQVKKGDYWISFAYTKDGEREKKASQVTGFYKCIVKLPRHGKLPPKAQAIAEKKKGAWQIKGESIGKPLSEPVVIPPLNRFLGEHVVHRRTIIRITKKQFDEIRRYTLDHRFKPDEIPCLRREPMYEQEVLAIVANDPERFGIMKVARIQTRFPDMLVKLKGRSEEVHLELELDSSSFLNHGHERQVKRGRFVGTRRAKGDGKPVAVLCWVDDDKGQAVRRHVHEIYELRDLLKHKDRIRW